MGKEKLVPRLLVAVLFVIACCSLQRLSASDDHKIFYESFDETFEGRWIVSDKADYQGVWKHSKSEGHDDYGLLVSEKAKKYAIVKELDEPVSLKDGTVVLQFETRLQEGLECGVAYLKYLRPQRAGWKPKEFDNDSPYSIMFGPDKCGATNKVHFIFKHKNPKSGEYVEHHLKYPPSVPSDKLSHVYTAILKPDNELRILIDGGQKKKANFLSAEDFEPPLIPAETIPDPDDKKPEDWDERAKIPDPNAVKPDDWDEDAPMEIEDEEAVKTEEWLDDEPKEVDWDDEEDGEWEAPKIDNPKCEAAPGCGEWKRPMKRNPAYKGKRHAPEIDNPKYKGIWKPQQIPNPDYFELERPDFEPVAAIGIEVWTMQDGILFDNVLIANDEKTAESIRETTWKPKFEVEKEKGEKQPNLIICILFCVILLKLVFGGKKNVSISSEMVPKIRAVEKILGYRFRNKTLLEEALTHSSYANSRSYQRLEFLGDAALGLAFCNYVFLAYPGLEPHHLSDLRDANISNEKLARVAVRHGLYRYVRFNDRALRDKVEEFVDAVGKGDDTSENFPDILPDIVESVAAAIYVDVDFNVQKLWEIFTHLLEPIVPLEGLQQHPVTMLNQLCQKRGKQPVFIYQEIGAKYIAKVYVDDVLLAASRPCKQKEIAKRDAAQQALPKLSPSPSNA